MEQMEDSNKLDAPVAASSSTASADARPMPKQLKLAQLIMNAAMIALSVIIALLLMFAPSMAVADIHFKKTSTNISALEYIIGFADVVSGDPYTEHYDELVRSKTSYSLLFEKDLAFKRSYVPTKFRAVSEGERKFVALLKAHYLNSIDLLKDNINLSEEEEQKLIDDVNKQMRKDLDVLYPLYELFMPDIFRMNYPGLKMFLSSVEDAYIEGTLDNELFKECEEEYLVFQNYSLKSVVEYFEDLEKKDLSEYSFDSVAEPVPSYNDMYIVKERTNSDGEDEITVTEKTASKYDQEVYGDGAEAGILFGILFLLFGFAQLLMTIPLIIRLVKDLKTTTLPSFDKKKRVLMPNSALVTAVINFLVIIFGYIIYSFTSSTFYAGLIAPVIIMILLIVGGEIAYKVLTKKFAKQQQ